MNEWGVRFVCVEGELRRRFFLFFLVVGFVSEP